jgi:CheY-like chemotaxis protein
MFGSKVSSTAQHLGLTVATVGSISAAVERAKTEGCKVILVDLGMPGLSVADLMAALPGEDRPKVIAFGAHVLTSLLDEAAEAGCDGVMPRSKFNATLPDLLCHYLDAGE